MKENTQIASEKAPQSMNRMVLYRGDELNFATGRGFVCLSSRGGCRRGFCPYPSIALCLVSG